MNKLSKRFAYLLLTIGCISVAPVAATPTASCACDPCVCDPCECGPANPSVCNPGCGPVHPSACNPGCGPVTSSCCSFDVGVDFLYWKPCVDDLDFAAKVEGVISDVDNPLEVRYQSVCPEWEPGYRIFLKRENAWKCFNLSLSYTWLNADDSERSNAHNGEGIAAVGLHPLFANVESDNNFFDSGRGKWELNYQTFDVLLSYPFHCGSCQTIAPFFGVEIVKFDQEWDSKYEITPFGSSLFTVGLAEWESDYTGAGLKIGTDYNYLLCDGLSLFTRISGTIAIGDAKTHNRQAQYIVDNAGVISDARYIEFKDDDCCHVIPGCHLQLGLQYENNACGCEYQLRFGYEAVKWYNLQNPRRWFEDTEGGNIAQAIHSNTTTLAFHGLLSGIEVKF